MGEPMDTVHFYSEGMRIEADLYRPVDEAAPDKLPAVLLCHGYNGVRTLYLPDVARALNAAGYVALAFDYKGWGDSEGPPLRLDPHGRVADAEAALTFLARQPGVDPERLGLFGWSFGGSTALWLAAADRRAKAVVSVVGVGDGERWMRSVRSESEWAALLSRAEADRLTRLATGTSEMVPRADILWMDPVSLQQSAQSRRNVKGAADRIPLEFVDETRGFVPEWIVDRVAPCAALFITCENDRMVPPEESIALHARAQDPKKLVVLPGYTHYDVYHGEALAAVMRETLAWLRTHLGCR